MVIKGDDYELTPVSETSNFWDLRLMKVVKPRGGVPREELGDPLYGMPLSAAITRIIHYRAKKHFKDQETVKLADYIKVLQMMDDQIRKELRETKKLKENDL